MPYDFQTIEAKWQRHWAENGTFHVPNPGEPGFDPDRPKLYVLDMFPYPSGAGLHVGHPLGYIATDIVSRYKRMRGYRVLHPIGYDAFGLPAEQYAIDHNVHPRETTDANIENMTRQLKQLGLGYDWQRCFATTDPGYYKWTQWIFLQLFHSWFDPGAGAARPIHELEQALSAEVYYVGPDGEIVAPPSEGLDAVTGSPIGARKWHELTPQQQRNLLDSYRLAYLSEVPVNWCPALGTVLANEEVTAEGRSERGNHPVYQRPLEQWMLRITAYADRLLADLDLVDWPEPIKAMQRNWIGRSEGAEIRFPLPDAGPDASEYDLLVFTTRPDTLFGATYMVLAPEHPVVDEITAEDRWEAVKAYREAAAEQSALDRQAEQKQKTGVFTGGYATNPANGEALPVWIADYVMMGYGTGAIMAVPAHDERDFAFAKQQELPIRPVVMPDDAWLRESAPEDAPTDAASLRAAYRADPARFADAFAGEGTGINSSNEAISLNDRPTPDAKRVIVDWLEESGNGRRQVQYRLQDWLFSRQRYWGEPFPLLHGPDGEIEAVPEDELPVELPPMTDFKPEPSADPDAPPQPPLARAPDEWKHVTRNGRTYTRELNTMPQWAGSCWYYLRFCDPDNDELFVDPDAQYYWMRGSEQSPAPGDAADAWLRPRDGVDLYVGGVEHAVLHLLYARFWHKVLYDLGHVFTPEPFGRLYNQGYIQREAYTDARGVYVPADKVEERDGRFFYGDEEVTEEFGKMGKSLKNAITPDDVCARYGADTLRLYEMYMGPLEQNKTWSTRDIVGVHRFLQRLWRNFFGDDESGSDGPPARVAERDPSDEENRLLHRTIQSVSGDMESLRFNTAIARLIELNNAALHWDDVPRTVAESVVRMIAPLAPHLGEELWQRLGHEPSVADAPWPAWDERYVRAETLELPVQVNGKVRARIEVDAEADEETIRATALREQRVTSFLDGKTPKKVVVVPGKLVNVVV